MKKYIPFILLLFIFTLSSCQLENSVQGDEGAAGSGYHLLLVSDEEYMDHEGEYFDALLELKQDFPEKLKNVSVVSSEQDLNKYAEGLEINHYPCLVVVKEQEVLTMIEGKQSEDFIIDNLVRTLNEQ
ncbi:hypothetical protein [Bacillus marinisedimentorum]|uniref:hypothetical protein n=1 Tax=Bacillus marinisedimentorum TaxID=1821260 RepID=UPI0007DFF07D|nr:hypothetical protein [Bacillus marinisedimentorum]